MKVLTIAGYFFCCLATLVIFVVFVNGLTDMINPSTAMLIGSSGSADDFLASFFSAMTPWIILSVVLFIVGGIGLFFGRNKKAANTQLNQEDLNSRFDKLESIIQNNFETVSKRLDALEKKQKKTKT